MNANQPIVHPILALHSALMIAASALKTMIAVLTIAFRMYVNLVVSYQHLLDNTMMDATAQKTLNVDLEHA